MQEHFKCLYIPVNGPDENIWHKITLKGTAKRKDKECHVWDNESRDTHFKHADNFVRHR